MAFTRKQITNSKVGTHLIRFQPGTHFRTCTVKRVRGDYVWVQANDSLVKLNHTASRLLMRGVYRAESVVIVEAVCDQEWEQLLRKLKPAEICWF